MDNVISPSLCVMTVEVNGIDQVKALADEAERAAAAIERLIEAMRQLRSSDAATPFVDPTNNPHLW